MTEQLKPRPLARIREAECIGCTKCIQACPVDAILGSSRQMHTVIAAECIGCKLCLPPCPVDCIDLDYPSEPFNHVDSAEETRKQRAAHIKKRYTARQKRLQSNQEQQYPSLANLLAANLSAELDERKAYVQQAIARMKRKKQSITKR